MLRACRRLLRTGGRIAFHTIFVSPGLSDSDYRRAVRAGAPSVALRRAHQELLETVGFVEVAEVDLTPEFLRVARGWLEGRERHAADLRAIEGDAEFALAQAERRRQVRAISEGLLRRSLFVARRGP